MVSPLFMYIDKISKMVGVKYIYRKRKLCRG